jgi:hypothetical protein
MSRGGFIQFLPAFQALFFLQLPRDGSAMDNSTLKWKPTAHPFRRPDAKIGISPAPVRCARCINRQRAKL